MQSTPENIVRAGEPSKSALRVATLRAVHQLLDDPIVFDDPMALPILGPETEAAVRADPFRFNDNFSRGLRAVLVVRSKFAEDELRLAVQSGVQQYVILGAGLDTFSFRNEYAAKGLRVYEVDHPSTQTWKKAILKDASFKIPESTMFVATDFEKCTLHERLQEHGFRVDRPAYFSWLGVTVYLSTEAIFETLGFVASLPKGSAITFDYRIMPSLLGPLERVLGEHLANMFAEQGEPWKTSFDPASFHKELRTIGFSATEDFGSAELNARYLARRKDGLQTADGFRLMCAKV